MKLITGVHVYAPEDRGICDVLTEGNRFRKIAEHIEAGEEEYIERIDGRGLLMTPGFIDLHEHIIGGGGEGGFSSRCPAAAKEDLVEAGVTSVVGLLGTDGITRSLNDLLAKTRALNEEGLTAWCLCGSYAYPPATITGSVETDIVLINEITGVKTALSDHRGSNISSEELIHLGSQARRAGLLSNKAGFVTIHMGDGKKGLKPLMAAVNDSDIPIQTFLPTHMSRNEKLLEEGIEWIRIGGMMDITAGSDKQSLHETSACIRRVLREGGGHALTVTSDAYGSLPSFDEKGNFIALSYVLPKVVREQFLTLLKDGVDMSMALALFTANPAHVLKLDQRKGHIREGSDADFLLWDESMCLKDVYAGGILLQNAISL